MSASSGGIDLSLERQDGGVAVLRAKGEIDLAQADNFEGVLGSAAGDAAAVVLDMREVQFLDSSGLRVMLLAAVDLGPRLAVLIKPDSPVARLIEVTEVSDRLAIYPTEEEALTAVAFAKPEDGG